MKRIAYVGLLALIVSACAGPALAQLANSCWPKFHRDIANTGQGLYGGTGSDLTWTYAAGAVIRSSPVVGIDGTSYFACDNGKLYAIAGDGSKRWDYTCNCQGTASPAVASDGTLFLASADKYVYAIRSDGTFRWKKILIAKPDTSITIAADGTLYVGCIEGTIYALGSDGSQKWTYKAGGAVTSAAIGSGAIYLGCADGSVYALYTTGTLKWKFTPAGSGGFAASPAVGPDGTVYIGSLGGFFYGINSTGTQKFRSNAGGEVRSTAAISPNGAILYGCRDHKLHCVNNLGQEQWVFTSGHYVDSSPAVGLDGGVFFASADGALYSLNPDGTERWHYGTGSAFFSSPAIGPAGCLFIGADNGTLYCFAADDTPPLEPAVTDDGAYTSFLDRIHAGWSASDPESGIFSYEYCIGTAPGLADVAGWLNVGSATSHTRTGLTLVDRQTYYVTARAINGAGLTGPTGNSNGIVADATAPTMPAVTDDGRYTSNATTLHAGWYADDPESGVAGYQYSIGRSAGATNVVGWTDVGPATSVTRTGLSLAGGTTYYFNVKALNGGGIYGPVGSSDGITVDVTAPLTPVVSDSGQYFSDAHAIFASWSSFDGESGISKFEYSVGTSPGGAQVLGWTDAGAAYQANITGLDLPNGGMYYVNVRATNGALLVSAVGSTDGITLDITPPSTPAVTDDGAFTASTTQLHATWTTSDAESGIKSYKYAIGTTAGGTEVVPWTNMGTSTSVTKTGLPLVDKQIYYIGVIATNGANAESAVGSSNGITVDATPPTAPVVTDDGAYTADSTQLHATWTASDPESGLARYEYSIGANPGGTDVVVWTDIGLNTSVTKTGLHLSDGSRYYVNVRAYNKVGVVSAVGSSDGIIVDLITPLAPTVTDDGAYTTNGASLHAVWTVVNCPSGVQLYEYSIGTAAGGTEVKGWTSVGLATQVTATGLSLASGSTYYINVRARNTLGKPGFVGSSDGIKVDLSAPPAPVVTDGGLWTNSASQLTASWTCSDPESGIAEYKYAVGTTPHGTNVLNWTSAGTNTSLMILGLTLADGGQYYISVKAVNNAGLTGPDGTTDGITVDLTPPTRPVVTDDGAYQLDPTRLHATWTSADPQSGIVKFEYSVGASAGATDVVAWTSAGTDTSANITGLSLTSGVRYYINIRATNGAGGVSEVGSSDGIFVELTPPTTPVVTDEGQYTQSLTTIRASWTSEDPETGIAGYQYSIGTSVGEADVVPWTSVALSTSIDRADLTLVQAQTYYVNVKATNGIGMVSDVGSSDGITVDTTPPGVPTITDDGDFASSNTQLHVVLDCIDEESGIASYECAVGTTSGGREVLDWTPVGPGPDATITGMNLGDGVRYYVSARATNGAGIRGGPGVSDGITIDASPPVGLKVTDDGRYTAFADRLHGRWSASDPQSGIASYRYCIGTSPGSNNVADWLDVGPATEHTREGLGLSPGVTYYITVIAINRARGESAPVSSDGILLDLTPPSRPAVTDTGRYWGYKSSIWGTWTSDDPESGIAEYQMSVGTSAGATDVGDWISVGNRTAYTRTGLHLTDGVTYYINIKAKNGAGQWSQVGSSDGVLIDSTPPTTPTVTDDGDTTSILDRLHAIWHSSDPESGIAEYLYCIGTSPGATDVLPWTSAGLAQDITVTGLDLDPVLRYYFSVKARSNSGAWSAVSASDGIGYSNGAAIWWRFRNDTANMGRGLFDATRVNDLGWVIPTQGYIESSPAISADGTTYIGSADGKLYAVTQNGTLRWTLNLGSLIESSPAIAADGSILIGSEDGKLRCISPAADVKWSYQATGAVHSSPLISNGRVYVGSAGGSLYALNLETGAKIWSHATGGPVRSSPAVDPSGVVYIASGDCYLYAVKPDGTRKWRFWTGSSADGSPAIGADGTIYVGSGNGCFYAVKPDGTKKWQYDTGFVADSSAAIGPNGNIYFGVGFDGGSGRMYALRPDGTKIWQVNLPGGGIVSSPAVDPSGMIYVGACDRKMYAFNPDGTVLWTYATQSSVVSSPALGADSSVVFGSYDGNIYCLRDVTSKDLTPPTTPVVTVPPVVSVGQPLRASWIATDPETMVAEYTYAIGTAPGLCDVAGWTSSGIETSATRDDLTLVPGTLYYVSVKARNPSQRWSEIGVSHGINVIPSRLIGSIGEIGEIDEGVEVVAAGKVVTAVFDDCVFIEEPGRFAGVRCVMAGSALKAGDRVNVTGKVRITNGERVLDPASCSDSTGGDPLAPIVVRGSITGLAQPNPLGLYVAICGKVTAVGTGYFVLDDGCRLESPRGAAGIEVRCTGCSVTVGNTVRACGILCVELVGGSPTVVLRAAGPSAIKLFPH